VWWLALAVGLILIGTGVVHLGRYFHEGPERHRSLAGSGPAHRLVAAAMCTAAGLFVSSFSLAHLVAERATSLP
jgi:hypothetical protein